YLSMTKPYIQTSRYWVPTHIAGSAPRRARSLDQRQPASIPSLHTSNGWSTPNPDSEPSKNLAQLPPFAYLDAVHHVPSLTKVSSGFGCGSHRRANLALSYA